MNKRTEHVDKVKQKQVTAVVYKLFMTEHAEYIRKMATQRIVESRRKVEDIQEARRERSKDVTEW